jgi:phosphatidylglycerol:prolipoprotein diacylglycerol transferase
VRPRIIALLDQGIGRDLASWLVPTPAVMYTLATIVATIIFLRRARNSCFSSYHSVGVALWAIIGTFLGARGFYLLQHFSETMAAPEQIWQVGGGICSWGAYLGAIAGLAAYSRIYRQDMVSYLDILASCAGLGIFLGRLSCFLNGDDFGTTSNLPWAVRFPHASMPFVGQVRVGLLSSTADLSLPVHPVQLYLSLTGLTLFGFASWTWKRYSGMRGLTFWSYLLAYSASRFCLEFVRGDQEQRILGLTVPQAMSILATGVALVALTKVLGRGYLPVAHRSLVSSSSD